MSQSDLPTHEPPVVQVAGVGKVYARQNRDMKRKLAAAAWRAFLGRKPRLQANIKGSQFWAVQGVSFQLARGEALGIIGLNGSGKTTLLRMLAGQIPVDAGEVAINGTSAAMIDLQAGFQSSASGYENIFLRAAALGFTRKEAKAHLQEIVDFSELGEAIHAPLATYSAGMRMRLAFSVMVIASPDVLLIDEVLAVGDFKFRQKCLAKVREMRGRSSFVFVSHSMSDVSRFCDRVIVMERGKVAFIGPPDAAIDVYLKQQITEDQLAAPPTPSAISVNVIEPFSLHKSVVAKGMEFFKPLAFTNSEFVSSVRFTVDGNKSEKIYKQCQDSLQFSVYADIKRQCRRLVFGFTILTEAGEGITGVASDSQNEVLSIDSAREVYSRVTIEKLNLMPGRYVVYFNMREGPELIYRSKLFEIVVDDPPHNTFGVMLLAHNWQVGEIHKQ